VSDLKSDLASLRLNEEPEKSRKGVWILLAVIVIAAGAGALAWRSAGSFSSVEVTAVSPVVEQTGSAAAGTPVLTASGYLVARREAVVSSKIQGRLSELHVEEGSEVQTGDILARLESSDYEAQLRRAHAGSEQSQAALVSADAAIQRAEADLAESMRQLGVNERLNGDKLVAIDTLDAARSKVRMSEAALGQAKADRARAAATLAQSKADVQLARAQLANTVILAPFAGTVVKKMAEVGESVAPIPPGVNISTASGAIVALADLATLEMEADVSEANVSRLTDEQPAEITVEAFPDRRYKAVLRQVIPTADRTKATVLTKVTLIEKDNDLKPEMSAKVTFLEPPKADGAAAAVVSKPQILVSQAAVVTRDGATKVFEIVDGRAAIRPIKTGVTRNDMVVVTDGLAGSEQLVSKPPDTLKDGDKVTIKK
jgi:RND family efflux transporter MFP subunit